jgi:type IV pilus assembly protein PilP
MKKILTALLGVTFVGVALIACGGDKGGTSAPPPTARGAGSAGALGDGGLPQTLTAKVEYTEGDFTESDRNRDPFRSYASAFAPENKKTIKSQIDAVLPQYSIDELKLVAIMTGGDYSRAMLLDPNNKGWVIKRGDYLGRPDVVHVGGTNGSDYQLNWRVRDVRDGEVVLVRQDPSQPAIAPATRVIPLHPEGEGKSNNQTEGLIAN